MFQRNTYLPLWLVRLVWLFENLPPLQVQYGSLPLPYKIIHNFSFYYIFLALQWMVVVQRKPWTLSFVLRFINFFKSSLLRRISVLIFQWRMEIIFTEEKLFFQHCRHSVTEMKVEQILRYYTVVLGSYIGRKVVEKVSSYI